VQGEIENFEGVLLSCALRRAKKFRPQASYFLMTI